LAINSLLVSVSGWHSSLEPFHFYVNCCHFRAAVFVHVGSIPSQLCTRMVFRFTCVECSAAEVACLAQNIRHSSASVRLHLVVFRCLSWTITLGLLTIFSPLTIGVEHWCVYSLNKASRPLNWNMKH